MPESRKLPEGLGAPGVLRPEAPGSPGAGPVDGAAKPRPVGVSAKTRVKNDLWRVNYIVPFAKKHLNGEGGPLAKARAVARALSSKRVVKGASRPRSVAGDTLALLSRVEISFDESEHFLHSIDERLTIAVPGNVFSNFALDYGMFVGGALDDVVEGATSSGDDFGERSALASEALHVLASRMLEAAEAAGLPDGDAGFFRECFGGMFSRPAAGFREGLQRVLFLNQAMWQTRHRLNGLGRLDKVLGGLYDADIAGGALTEGEGRAMVLDFLSVLHAHYEFKSDALMGDIGQIIVLGGLEPDGSYFRNALTDLFLECQAESGFPDPKVFLRVSSAAPRDLVEKAVSALRSSTGSPLLSNDDRVIPALEGFGVLREDACGYCVSACWEPLVPGRSIGQNNMAVFDACEAFVGAAGGLPDDASWEDAVAACAQAEGASFGRFLRSLDGFKWAEDPLVSLFYPDCVSSRTDISRGGARYCNYGVTVVGVADVVDSLLNMGRLMESGLAMGELKALLESGAAGDPDLREALRAPAGFGSDEGAAAELTNLITSAMNAAAEGYRNPLGGKAKFGLSSPAYIMAGRRGPADLSGRGAGDPYTVHISSRSAAYTELVNFSAALDYSGHRFNGNVVDFFVAPSLLREHPGKFADFLEAAVRAGFFQMQMNVMDSATLMDAKANPGRYPGLVVRVWGFSAYFNDLPESYKDYLIERALASEAAA